MGFFIPDESIFSDFNNDANPAIQTHKFNKNFISILECSGKYDVDYVSNRPISIYPKNKKIIVNCSSHEYVIENKNIIIYESGFINFPVLKLISRFFFTFISVLKKLVNKQYDMVIVYSVHLPYLVIGVLVSKIFNIKIIALWTDPPSVHTSKNIFVKYLRCGEYALSKFFMSKFDKSIVVSKYLALDFNSNAPYFVLEGISNLDKIKPVRDTSLLSKPISIVYAGSLEKTYGLSNVIDAVSFFDEGRINLELYGFGSMVPWLKEAKLKNVTFKGSVAPQKISKILEEADFLINCRSEQDDFTKYSFPSKTMEYLVSGTPVIMTMLKGIPSIYSDFVTPVKDNRPESIFEAIQAGIENYELCLKKARNGLCYMESKSIRAWAEKLEEFI